MSIKNLDSRNIFIKKSIIIFFSYLILMVIGCTPSLVYDPSINLPPEPIAGGHFQISTGFGMLPEARPHKMKDDVAFGQNLFIRYSPFDRFTLQLSGWIDRSNNSEDERSGISYTNIILLNSKKSRIRISLVPNGTFLFINGTMEGGGGAMRLAFGLPKYRFINPYIATGAGLGMRNIEGKNNEWGWGFVTNMGLSTKIYNHFTVNIELSYIKQVNEDEHLTNNIFVPNVNFGFQF